MRRVTVLLAALAVPAAASAQWAAGPRSAGMAGAGMVFAEGFAAVEWNPANLANSPGWTVSLLDVGGSGLIVGTTLGDLIDIARAGGDGESALVSRLPASGLRLSAAAEGFALGRGVEAADLPGTGATLPSVGLSVGPIGVRVRSRVLTDVGLSKELADLTVNGFNPERIREYAVRKTGFRMTSFTDVTVGYGVSVGPLSLGAGARYVQGHRLSQGRLFEPEIDLDGESLRLTGVAVEAPGGSGWGVDVGLAIDVGAGVRWSLAARNVVQRMTWDGALVAHQAVLTDEDFDSSDATDLIDRFQASPLDATGVPLPVFEAARDLFDEAFFPMVVHTGLGWEGGAGTRLEAVATAVAPRGRQHAPWEQQLSVGAEQAVGPLTLRAGLSRADDGVQAVSGGLGIGLGPVRIDVGVGRLSGSFEGIAYDGLHASLGLSVRGGGS